MGECMIDSLCVESAHRKKSGGGGALTEGGVFTLFVISVVERRASWSQRWVGEGGDWSMRRAVRRGLL